MLSIIDLKLGKQPIENENIILIANGEIYNDTQIRKKYSNFNYKTNSDSESILAVYKNKGIFGFNELRGMYAFSIYDKKNQLIISRDEFGIKPLYFSTCQGAIMFCSEISTLRKLSKKKKKKKKLIIKKLLNTFNISIVLETKQYSRKFESSARRNFSN